MLLYFIGGNLTLSTFKVCSPQCGTFRMKDTNICEKAVKMSTIGRVHVTSQHSYQPKV